MTCKRRAQKEKYRKKSMQQRWEKKKYRNRVKVIMKKIAQTLKAYEKTYKNIQKYTKKYKSR